MSRLTIVLMLVACTMACGCQHGLRIANLDEYVSRSRHQTLNKTIAVVDEYLDGKSMQRPQIIEKIALELEKSGAFKRVVFPYNPSRTETEGDAVDVIVHVGLSSQYRGDIGNYFITFPGYIIFLPAIIGYRYRHINTLQVEVRDASRKVVLNTFSVPATYKIRQADLNRTWVEAGWPLLWFWAPVPFIAGFFHTGYDRSVTQPATNEYLYNYARYAAAQIIENMSTLEK